MARIKTCKYDFDGQEITVNFNCSTSGLFSANLHRTIQEKLGLSGRLEFSSLSELEKVINDAFIAYKNALTSYKLMIAICFGASGEFLKKPDGEWNESFYPHANNPHKISLSFSRVNSAIGIDYRVLIEENRDGRINYHSTRSINDNRFEKRHDWEKQVGNYYISGTTNVWGEEKLIEYSETALDNLKSITRQLQNASVFLVNLIKSDKIELILSSENLKQLT